ncbi:MAG: PPC domain-containing protein [Candidatus Omnitrophota bacterium]
MKKKNISVGSLSLSLSMLIFMILASVLLPCGAYAQNGAGYDDAIPLSTGETVSGSVGLNSTKYYSFRLESGQSAKITMQPVGSDKDLYIDGPAGGQIGVSGNQNTELEQCDIAASESGTYYARVHGFTEGLFTINVAVKGGAAQPASSAAAQTDGGFFGAMPLSGTHTASISAGQKHYYWFELSTGQTAAVRLSASSWDQDLYLYSAPDEGALIQISGNQRGQSEEVSVTASADTRYYVKVDGCETGPYTLTLSIEGGEEPAIQPKASVSGGFMNAAPLSGTLTTLISTGQKHYYWFELSRGQSATVSMPASQSDQDLYIYSAPDEGSPIQVSGNQRGQSEEVSVTAAADTKYYVKVDGFEAGTYTLNLSVSGGPGQPAAPAAGSAPSPDKDTVPVSVILTSHTDKNKRADNRPRFHWKIEPETPGIAVKYRVYIGTDPNNMKPLYNNNLISEPYCDTDKPLFYDTTYYWKVRAFNAAGAVLGESETAEIITLFPNEDTIKLSNPISVDLFEGEALKIWFDTPDIYSMKLHFEYIKAAPEWSAVQVTDPKGAVAWEISVTEIEDMYSAPLSGNTCFLQIRRANEDDPVSYSIDLINYSIKDPSVKLTEANVHYEIVSRPEAPAPETVDARNDFPEKRVMLKYPADGQEFDSFMDVQFRWQADKEGTRPQYYSFYIGTVPDTLSLRMDSILAQMYTISSREMSSLLDDNRRLYWCVSCTYYDPVSNSSITTRSPVRSFSFKEPDKPVVRLTRPYPDSKNVSPKLTFHWAVDPSEFRFYRSRLLLGKTPEQLEPITPLISEFYYSMDKDSLEYDTTYFWKARVFAPEGKDPVAESEVFSFRTESRPWIEVILEPAELEKINRAGLLPGQAIKVTLPGSSMNKAYFSEIRCTADWGLVQIVDSSGGILWERRAAIPDVYTDVFDGPSFIIRTRKTKEEDEASYTITKLYYKGADSVIFSRDVQIEIVGDPVSGKDESETFKTTNDPCSGIEEARVRLNRPDAGKRFSYSTDIRFSWSVDTRGIPYDTCDYSLYAGASKETMAEFSGLKNAGYNLGAREIERLLGPDEKERKIIWQVKAVYTIKGQPGQYKAFCSPPRDFFVDPPVKPSIILNKPDDNAKNIIAGPVISWRISSGLTGVSYRSRLFMGKDKENMAPVSPKIDTSYFSLADRPLDPDTTYFWQIKLYDHISDDPVAESGTRSFKTEAEGWKEIVLEEPELGLINRTDLPASKVLRVEVPCGYVKVNFADVLTAPDKAWVEITDTAGMLLWQISGSVYDVKSKPVSGGIFNIRGNKTSMEDELKYDIDKLYYREAGKTLTSSDVKITIRDDPAGAMENAVNLEEKETPLEDVVEARVDLKLPESEAGVPYGAPVTFSWEVDTEGLDYDTFSFDLYVGTDTKKMFSVENLETSSYTLSPRDIEGILENSPDRWLYWSVQCRSSVRGEPGTVRVFRSPVRSFLARREVTPVVTLETPSNNESGVYRSTQLRWNVKDADTGESLSGVSYRSQVFLSEEGKPLAAISQPLDYWLYSLKLHVLEFDRSYQWMIKVIDPARNKVVAESPVWHFSTEKQMVIYYKKAEKNVAEIIKKAKEEKSREGDTVKKTDQPPVRPETLTERPPQVPALTKKEPAERKVDMTKLIGSLETVSNRNKPVVMPPPVVSGGGGAGAGSAAAAGKQPSYDPNPEIERVTALAGKVQFPNIFKNPDGFRSGLNQLIGYFRELSQIVRAYKSGVTAANLEKLRDLANTERAKARDLIRALENSKYARIKNQTLKPLTDLEAEATKLAELSGGAVNRQTSVDTREYEENKKKIERETKKQLKELDALYKR